ncbi:MAG TPA: class I SAM-dependent methyltransferase [Nitrospiraceae bacterium]|jgi:caffeoyl-CoA O-methyltransferase|nr:class I SAM-dependent methyltransferase [Nitrospiraceae bacterium]
MKDLVLPEIEAYAEAHSWAESPVCRALREETCRSMEFPQMVVGPLEGAFLKMMVQVVQAKRVLEVGTFTGYSALCFAEALPGDGQVITCDIDEQSVGLAKTYWAKSPYGGKIKSRLGPAVETLATLSEPFDVIFIDADKINYLQYYRRALELIASRGVILIDNVLWSGDVLKSEGVESSTAAIQELNRIIAADRSVNAVLVTIRDGIFVVRKA